MSKTIKILFTSVKPFEREFYDAENRKYGFQIDYEPQRLGLKNVKRAQGYEAIGCFVNDDLSAPVIEELCRVGVRLIALRSAGYDHVDLKAAKGKIHVVRVPRYSPNSVAEHAVGLMLALNRKICLADQKVHGNNFSLDGLIGFDMFGKTAGIIGAGNIGKVVVQILRGFGMRVLIYDILKDEAFAKGVGAEYTDLNTLLAKSDIVSLHTPLNQETHYLIGKKTLSKMKDGAMLINTGRGGLVNTLDLIDALKSKKLSCAGLDVYEKESGYFFEDFSKRGIDDPVLLELLSLSNVLITPHQAFFTREAMQGIVEATLKSVSDFSQNNPLLNEVTV